MVLFPGVNTVDDYFSLPEITFFASASDLNGLNKSNGTVTYNDGHDIYRNVEHYYCGIYEQFGRSGEEQLVSHSKYALIDYELVDSLTIAYGERNIFPELSSTLTFSNQNDLKKYLHFIEARNSFISQMCDEAVKKANEAIDSGFEYDLLHNTCNNMRESLTDAVVENNVLFTLLMISFSTVSPVVGVFLKIPETKRRNIFQMIQTDQEVENIYFQLLEWVKNARSIFMNAFLDKNEHIATLAVYLMVYRGLLDYYSNVWINDYDGTPLTIDTESYICDCVKRHTVSSTDDRAVVALVYYLLNLGALSDNYRIPYEYVLNCITKAENGETINTSNKETKPYGMENTFDSIHNAYVKEPSAIDELNSLIGLNSVKNDVNELISLVKMNMKRKEKGLPLIPVSLHLVFTGNPGTGKTTVARILAKLYKEIGVLPKGQLIEVDRSGLVAGYVGQTALKTQEKIQEAMGGILFIDEAYSLSKDGQDFGQEAIDTILKAMEDYRDKFVVIVAGYPDLMKTFINSNPGLRSRFNKYISFEDYGEQDLLKIFVSMCQRYHLTIDAEAIGKVKDRIRSLVNKKDDNFANARDIRNLFENTVTNQARRLAVIENISDEDMTCIMAEDI